LEAKIKELLIGNTELSELKTNNELLEE